MLLFSRDTSQYCEKVPSQLSGQSPWTVQELLGPVDVDPVSQN